jgi:hypothetical protein
VELVEELGVLVMEGDDKELDEEPEALVTEELVVKEVVTELVTLDDEELVETVDEEVGKAEEELIFNVLVLEEELEELVGLLVEPASTVNNGSVKCNSRPTRGCGSCLGRRRGTRRTRCHRA